MPWCNLRWHLPLPHQSCVLRWIAVFCDVTRLVLGVLGNARLTWAGVVRDAVVSAGWGGEGCGGKRGGVQWGCRGENVVRVSWCGRTGPGPDRLG